MVWTLRHPVRSKCGAYGLLAPRALSLQAIAQNHLEIDRRERLLMFCRVRLAQPLRLLQQCMGAAVGQRVRILALADDDGGGHGGGENVIVLKRLSHELPHVPLVGQAETARKIQRPGCGEQGIQVVATQDKREDSHKLLLFLAAPHFSGGAAPLQLLCRIGQAAANGACQPLGKAMERILIGATAKKFAHAVAVGHQVGNVTAPVFPRQFIRVFRPREIIVLVRVARDRFQERIQEIAALRSALARFVLARAAEIARLHILKPFLARQHGILHRRRYPARSAERDIRHMYFGSVVLAVQLGAAQRLACRVVVFGGQIIRDEVRRRDGERAVHDEAVEFRQLFAKALGEPFGILPRKKRSEAPAVVHDGLTTKRFHQLEHTMLLVAMEAAQQLACPHHLSQAGGAEDEILNLVGLSG
ncbi:MAG TPA: hypothetical protein DEP84_26505 [Chloroflexi bacterium]|nr:hypothetical protein [Chloroflexota bacterium]